MFSKILFTVGLGGLLLCPPVDAQLILGRTTTDKFIPPFWSQNTNANSVALGLRNATAPMALPNTTVSASNVTANYDLRFLTMVVTDDTRLHSTEYGAANSVIANWRMANLPAFGVNGPGNHTVESFLRWGDLASQLSVITNNFDYVNDALESLDNDLGSLYDLATANDQALYEFIDESFATSASNGLKPTLESVTDPDSFNPFFWTNTTALNLHVNISAGRIQGVGINGGLWSAGITNGSVLCPLQPGEWLSITNNNSANIPRLAWKPY